MDACHQARFNGVNIFTISGAQNGVVQGFANDLLALTARGKAAPASLKAP